MKNERELEAGLFQMPMNDYLTLDALSSHLCHMLLTRSPAHARYEQAHPTGANGAMDLGTIAHQMLLEGSDSMIEIVDAPDWRTKHAREARETARQEGKTPILADDMAEVRSMVEVARAYLASSEIAGVLEQGKPEQTLLWEEGGIGKPRRGGTWCKARPDWLANDFRTMIHFKTTQGRANPEWFSSRMVDMGYDMAAAFYTRGVQYVCGVTPSRLLSVFLVQESSAPYACSLIGLAPSLMELAVVKVEHALQVWGTCLAEWRWPAYPVEICYTEARPWQITQMAEKALAWGDYETFERITELTGGRP